ncbi:cyclic nucleotide-binding domain-containing protein [Caenimonas aquaedulcis]|uniref:SLC26A/SulP transporter family protein n=1 Tax=Caenimonas aquaedulcis TaxID=2793270 RepID=A0A931H839_9BURK|nr:cyclic nucleotide-binding domain-containing protein [Caenimonas aquaedulcis]MBG9390456.1 SLC26A/SulP transporter family protein [Caenimonas aquaedulcis]
MTPSSFNPLESTANRPAASWSRSTVGALEGAAFTIPVSLACVTLVFGRIGPDMLAHGVLATLLGLVLVHLAGSFNSRPVLYSARFFESTTIAAMLDQAIALMGAWDLADTPGTRLALLCVIGAGAGIVFGALYLVRADRFTRFIPAPVFAGFSTSISLLLLLSQARGLASLLARDSTPAVIALIALAAMAVTFAVRRWRPRWPASALGLAAGLLIGLGWVATGHNTPMVAGTAAQASLPVFLADFRALVAPPVQGWLIARSVVIDSLILGAMMFINTNLAAQAATLEDRRTGRRGNLFTAGAVTLSAILGSAPVSGTMQSTVTAMRQVALGPRVLALSAAIFIVVYASGVLGWVPLAAVCGALLCEAWFMADRPFLALLVQWARRRPMAVNAREDLSLVAAVTATAVLFNMVVAVFAGLLLGLVLFAARNARRPVRNVWSGVQMSSNCARSRADLRVLADHGAGIRIVELEGDLFFGTAEGLERMLHSGCRGAECIVLDWSRVHHVDTSIAIAVARFERDVRLQSVMLLHAGADVQAGNVRGELLRHCPSARLEPDLDHALEQAENEMIRRYAAGGGTETTSVQEALTLFRGLDAREIAQLEDAMKQRFLPRGTVIFSADDTADELMLLQQGSAEILVRSPEGRDIRLASLRRGATLGEIGFLDGARRSATAVAREDSMVAVLSREAFESLSAREPALIQRLLSNIAVDMAARLRHTNRLAIARTAQR